MANYFRILLERVGEGWNRFWFTPSDPAMLACVRVLTGLVAIYLHLTFTPDLVAFFGTDGLLSPELAAQLGFDPAANASWAGSGLSYLNYLHSPAELHLLHWLGLAALVLFTVGFLTRVTSVLALIVVLSYFHRGMVLTGEAEPVLAFLMFYLCLAPSGRWLSVDAWLASRKAPAAIEPPAASWGATVATRLIQIHVAAVCLMMAAGMTMATVIGPMWWNGEAMWWLIAKPASPLVDFTWLHDSILLVNLWTHVTFWYLVAFGLLIWRPLFRPLLLVIGVPVWGLLALVTGLVPFCGLMFIGGLAFIPGSVVRSRWPVSRGRGEVASAARPVADRTMVTAI
jgi:hypothetical protein